jgi:hypothetical protein
VNHKEQESSLSEWCNAPSAVKLWSQIWSNQPNSYINSNPAIKRETTRTRSIYTELTTPMYYSRTLESKWEANWPINLNKYWEFSIHSTNFTINNQFKSSELQRRRKGECIQWKLGARDVIVLNFDQFMIFNTVNCIFVFSSFNSVKFLNFLDWTFSLSYRLAI